MTAMVHQHRSLCNATPNSWKEKFTTMHFFGLLGLCMLPGVNSSHVTNRFQGVAIAPGWLCKADLKIACMVSDALTDAATSELGSATGTETSPPSTSGSASTRRARLNGARATSRSFCLPTCWSERVLTMWSMLDIELPLTLTTLCSCCNRLFWTFRGGSSVVRGAASVIRGSTRGGPSVIRGSTTSASLLLLLAIAEASSGGAQILNKMARRIAQCDMQNFDKN